MRIDDDAFGWPLPQNVRDALATLAEDGHIKAHSCFPIRAQQNTNVVMHLTRRNPSGYEWTRFTLTQADLQKTVAQLIDGLRPLVTQLAWQE